MGLLFWTTLTVFGGLSLAVATLELDKLLR